MSKFISVPVKKTKEVDWIEPLKKYIERLYGSTAEFEHEIAAFNKLRIDIVHCDQDPIGRDLYYKYYGQLELLELRIALDTLGIEFCWYDAFITSLSNKQHSIAFEKASVLFNLAAIMSHVAAHSDDLKVSYEWFQKSSGVFKFIQESFLHAPSEDLSVQCVESLSKLMLAQAQEAFLLRYIETNDEPKPSLVSRLAKATGKMYGTSSEQIESLKSIQYSWGQYTKIKELYYLSIANYQNALLLKASGKYGQAIAYVKQAEELIKKHQKYSYRHNPGFQEKVKTQISLIKEELELLEKDNDFIYHDMVPSAAALAEIKPMESAKPITIADQKITEIVGRDAFEKIVPLKVHELSSMYSEEVAKVLRAESEKCELADLEFSSTLEFLQLPKSLSDLRSLLDEAEQETDDQLDNDSIDPQVLQAASAVFGTNVDLSKTATLRSQVQSNLDLCDRLISQENQKYASLKAKYGSAFTQEQYPTQLISFQQDLARGKKSLLDAQATDKKIGEIYSGIKDDVDLLSKGPSSQALLSLYKKEPPAQVSLLDMDDQEGDVAGARQKLAKVDTKLQELRYLQKERSNTYEDLKTKGHGDDISKVLLVNRDQQDMDPIFEEELAKFRPYQERIALTVDKQVPLINELKQAMNTVLDDATLKSKLRKREKRNSTTKAVNSRLLGSYEQWKTYKGGVVEGQSFYERLLTFSSNLRFALEKFVGERSNEADKLVSHIELNGPQRDQDLLRQQFERFNLQTQAPPPRQYSQYSQYSNSPGGSFSSSSGGAPPLPSKPNASTDFYSTPSAYDPSLYSQFNRQS
ncbi:hypothetical protein OGAPHI_000723 [Ogataea philodendri]|uniref:BRO domain-containing protein 1 n=1 Tax=Ogataea philodendri TaxID=1378263 RepID=A0A9P8PFC3_9ASCO|nr:uncharacterized protein OGAPHI_000723 [Ogataea philodendri]KAH3671012.1 hypothetical protein OGAPHI_000723 [Ogataea philodendri]